jgi:hypothetical protein
MSEKIFCDRCQRPIESKVHRLGQHAPLVMIETIVTQSGLNLTDTTVVDWCRRCVVDALMFEEMRDLLVPAVHFHAREAAREDQKS